MEWKSINFAPKDGTEISACNFNRYRPVTVSWRSFQNNNGKMAWRDERGFIQDKLTHFQMLPAPPKREPRKQWIPR